MDLTLKFYFQHFVLSSTKWEHDMQVTFKNCQNIFKTNHTNILIVNGIQYNRLHLFSGTEQEINFL